MPPEAETFVETDTDTDAASAMTSSEPGLRDAPAYTTLAFSDATLHAYVQVNWEDDWFGAFVVGKTDTNVAVVYLEDDGRTDTSTPEAREEEFSLTPDAFAQGNVRQPTGGRVPEYAAPPSVRRRSASLMSLMV